MPYHILIRLERFTAFKDFVIAIINKYVNDKISSVIAPAMSKLENCLSCTKIDTYLSLLYSIQILICRIIFYLFVDYINDYLLNSLEQIDTREDESIVVKRENISKQIKKHQDAINVIQKL
jgi:hypothetical protein